MPLELHLADVLSSNNQTFGPPVLGRFLPQLNVSAQDTFSKFSCAIFGCAPVVLATCFSWTVASTFARDP